MRILIAAGLAAVLLSSSAGAAPEPGAGGPAAARAAPNVAPADAPTFQPGSSELLFVPLRAPCRAFNVKVHAKTVKPLHIGGTAQFQSQGGRAGGCGIPNSAAAISISLTALGASAKGYATAWRYGDTRPNIITTSVPSHEKVTTGATVALGSGLINIYPSQTTRFIGDVTGYYVLPMAGMISSGGTLYAGSSRLVSSTRAAVGVYNVVFDRNIRYCTAIVTVYSSGYYASASTYYGSNSNSVRVYVWTSAGAPADQYFYISVRC